jgi:hypothetical protein
MKQYVLKAIIISFFGCFTLVIGRSYIKNYLITMIQPKIEGVKDTENDSLKNTSKPKTNKKVKVNYPLFVKKSRNNMFKRAIREDFKRDEPPVAKEKTRVLNDSVLGENLEESVNHRKLSVSMIDQQFD